MAWTSGHKLQSGYTIKAELERGGFAVTYLAEDGNGEKVVIKTLNEQVQQRLDFDTFQDNFLKEAMRLSKCLDHHIVKIKNFCPEGVLWCMVLEYIEGETLSALVNKSGILSEDEALKYIQQIGEALILVHNNGLLHRDVKPDNIIVRADTQEAVLIDFGIAREFKPLQRQIYTVFISPGYSPIEQHKQEESGYYTDVYGLAATLYFILTATVPPSAEDRDQEIKKSNPDPLLLPNSLNPQISDRVNQAIITGMELSSKKRSQSIQEWLNLWQSSPVSNPQPPTNLITNQHQQSSVNQSTKKLLPVYIGGIIVILGIVGGFLYKNRPLPPDILEFTIKSVYSIGETITLTKTRVCDENGAIDIQKIRFYVKEDTQQDNEDNWKYINEFSPIPLDNNGKCASFIGKIEANKLPPAGNYQLRAIAIDKSNLTKKLIQAFKINARPILSNLSVEQSYPINEPIKINDIIVCDDNLVNDIDRIDFAIKERGKIKALRFKVLIPNISKPNLNNKCTEKFNYEAKEASNLPAGNYRLQAIAVDKSNEKSLLYLRNFKVNAPPRDVQFFGNKVNYIIGEVLQINNTRFCDDNGFEDIKNVVFEWRLKNANWLKFGELSKNQFQVDPKDFRCFISTIPVSLTLPSLGEYEIQATASDIESKFSTYTRNFQAIQPASPNPTFPPKF